MVNQWILKLLLLPFALLYGLGVAIRNGLYATGILRGVSFSMPVISIGNLSVGGTGKTPHTEYIIRVLHQYLPLAVVSRGYKRKTSGYVDVSVRHDATQVGDEPLQFKRKYPHVAVAVSESRSLAIPRLMRSFPHVKVVLMDDGYQHLEVKPGLNILLTEHDRLYTKDFLLPVGRLREWRNGASRADFIVVTKCPPSVTKPDMERIEQDVRRNEKQQVFFSEYHYGHPYKMYGQGERLTLHPDIDVLLVVAIAGTEYLLEYVEEKCGDVFMLSYNDHHPFSLFDIGEIERRFKHIESERQRIILTTEKDAMRLDTHRERLAQLNLPIYILPVAVRFLGDRPDAFDQAIKDWLLNFKR